MKTRVQKWGNSLALRIPRAFAEETDLRENSAVDVSIRGGKLVVAPVAEQELSLEELIEGIKPENRHGEISTGDAVGNEVW